MAALDPNPNSDLKTVFSSWTQLSFPEKGTFKRMKCFLGSWLPLRAQEGPGWEGQKSLGDGIVLEQTIALTFQRKNPSLEQSQAPGWTTARSSGWRKIQSPFQGSYTIKQKDPSRTWEVSVSFRTLPRAAPILRAAELQDRTHGDFCPAQSGWWWSGKRAEMMPGNTKLPILLEKCRWEGKDDTASYIYQII